MITHRVTGVGGGEVLPFAQPDIGEDEISAVVEALRSGWVSSGPRVRAFEREFADVIGGGVEAVAVNSATAGLHLALEACDVGQGHEVLVPTWTFTATAEVVRYLGAEPVLVDVDPQGLTIDLADAARRLTPRTRAIMPVHFAGAMCDPGPLAQFAEAHGLRVVEDAAHAFPAARAGESVGSGRSDATVFSFYATKTMTTGEGGMLVTADPRVASRARTMRLHGISRDAFDRYRSATPAWFYEVVDAGYKYNLTDPAAAMGRVQLARSQQMWSRRRDIAASYTRRFSGLPLETPWIGPEDGVHSWHLYVVRLHAEQSRDRFIAAMSEHGVGCSVHFIPLHLHPHWRKHCKVEREDFPVASAVFPAVVSLPIFSTMTDEQVEKVMVAVEQSLR